MAERFYSEYGPGPEIQPDCHKEGKAEYKDREEKHCPGRNRIYQLSFGHPSPEELPKGGGKTPLHLAFHSSSFKDFSLSGPGKGRLVPTSSTIFVPSPERANLINSF